MTQAEVLQIMENNKPISIVRAGDGEKIVLESNNGIPQYQTCINSVMKRQIGYEPTMSEVDAIRENLIEAYKGADIIGIPMQKNLNDLGKHWNGVAKIIDQYNTTSPRCSLDVCYDMLYDGSLVEWLRNKPVVNYISCRDLDEGFYRIGIKQPNKFIIAPEAKFTTYKGEGHYPDQFNKVERWMSKIAIKGNPCLVGAGVIGKIYCNWFRDRGGIAIDIGAVFDLLAGRVTRGPLRGLDAEFEKYKI